MESVEGYDTPPPVRHFKNIPLLHMILITGRVCQALDKNGESGTDVLDILKTLDKV